VERMKTQECKAGAWLNASRTSSREISSYALAWGHEFGAVLRVGPVPVPCGCTEGLAPRLSGCVWLCQKKNKVCKEMLCTEQPAGSTGARVPVKQIDTGYFLFAFCFIMCAGATSQACAVRRALLRSNRNEKRFH